MNDNNNYENEFQEEIEIIAEEFETEDDLKVLNECWHISAHPYKEEPSIKIEPQYWIDKLNLIGSIKNIRVISDGIPSSDQYDPENSYLGFEIDFKCDKSKNDIDIYLNQLRDNYKIRILPPYSSISDYIDLIDELADKSMRIGEILKEIGSLTDFELEEVLNIQSEYANENNDDNGQVPIGELLVQEKMIHDSVLKAALDKQDKLRKK